MGSVANVLDVRCSAFYVCVVFKMCGIRLLMQSVLKDLFLVICMRRGISPVIVVVFLISISFIAGLNLYFWLSGFATQQPSSPKPNPITVIPIGSGRVLIANLGYTEIEQDGIAISS